MFTYSVSHLSETEFLMGLFAMRICFLNGDIVTECNT